MSDRIDLERQRTTVDNFQDDLTDGLAKPPCALAQHREDVDFVIAEDGLSYGATAWQRGQVPATEPAIAATIAVHGMMNGGFTGRKLSDYDQKPDGFDFVRARQVVNGMDRAEDIAGYAKRYRALMGN
jgi:hypothetical protein